MKAKRLFLFLAMPVILALVSCDNGTTNGGYNVPGSTLAEKLDWLRTNAESDGSYILDVNTDESINSNQRLEYSGKNNVTITLRGSGGSRIVSLSNNGNMFQVRTGVTLVLDNITLRGHGFNSNSLVYVRSGGALLMNNGAVLTGNITEGNSGGGVWVEGTFTMNSGTISGNAAKNDGGGVVVSGGSFTMNGGTISGNNASNGGGVAVLAKGTFVMSGGTISGNIARTGGGGAAVLYGTFTMSGGTISGNISEGDGGGVVATNVSGTGGSVTGIGNFIMNGGTISSNSARSGGGGVGVSSEGTFVMNNGSITENSGTNGGGVSVALNTTFTMSGGTISGNTASTNGGGIFVVGVFTKTGGTITGYNSDRRIGNVVSNSRGIAETESGHAVYAYYSGSRVRKRKESTAGTETNLSYAGRTGSFSGEWDF